MIATVVVVFFVLLAFSVAEAGGCGDGFELLPSLSTKFLSRFTLDGRE
jgi:hypothetical protein